MREREAESSEGGWCWECDKGCKENVCSRHSDEEERCDGEDIVRERNTYRLAARVCRDSAGPAQPEDREGEGGGFVEREYQQN